MINGYVTYDELKILTGLDDSQLGKMIRQGLALHELDMTPIDGRTSNNVKVNLFNLRQVLDWMSIHIY